MNASALAALKGDVQSLASTADRMGESALSILNRIGALESANGSEAIGEDFNRFGVVRYFEDADGQFSYSSWFRMWGGWVGAGHSDEGLKAAKPNFVTAKTEILRPGNMDFVGYGITLPKEPPKQLVEGERFDLVGFPAGSKHPARRTGKVYIERPEETRNGDGPSWIIDHDRHQEPSLGGMSGGAGAGPNDDEPRAVIITQNGKADVNFDGYQTHSSDVVSLRDIWDYFAQGTGLARIEKGLPVT